MNMPDVTFSAEFYPNGAPLDVRASIPEVPMLPVSRNAIQFLQERLLESFPEYDGDERTHHHFAPGIYAREYRMNSGEVVIGKIHRHQHFALLVSGDAYVATERGQELVTGPMFFLSYPGAKRAVYAVTDVIFLTIHPNPSDTRDIAELEYEMVCSTYEEYDARAM